MYLINTDLIFLTLTNLMPAFEISHTEPDSDVCSPVLLGLFLVSGCTDFCSVVSVPSGNPDYVIIWVPFVYVGAII